MYHLCRCTIFSSNDFEFHDFISYCRSFILHYVHTDDDFLLQPSVMQAIECEINRVQTDGDLILQPSVMQALEHEINRGHTDGDLMVARSVTHAILFIDLKDVNEAHIIFNASREH